MRGKLGFISPVRPFSPISISGITAWWDASDAATLFDAVDAGSAVSADGAVARMEDKTGNNRHFRASTAGTRPIRKTAVQNGRDAIRFDGSNDRMFSSADFDDAFSSTASTCFIVAKATAVTTNNAVIYENEVVLSETGGLHSWFVLKSDDTVASSGFDSDDRVASLTYIPGSWVVLTSWHDGSNIFASINGGTPASTALGTRTGTTFALNLGADYSQTYFFNGDVGEIIAYNQALSSGNRSAVQSDLMTKWGIS
jgi:hypothetical protein